MAKRNHRTDNVLESLERWCDTRNLDIKRFSSIHTRLSDDYTTIDIWPTTGRYWVGCTAYYQQSYHRTIERGGEKGMLPIGADQIITWLDELFFAAYQ